jgi:hypothetical protein
MMRRFAPARILGTLAGVASGVLASPFVAFAQCAMCGSAAASSPGVARGMAYSIFFLLGMLALVVSWFVALVLRSQARARKGVGRLAPAGGAPSIAASPLPTGHAPAEK